MQAKHAFKGLLHPAIAIQHKNWGSHKMKFHLKPKIQILGWGGGIEHHKQAGGKQIRKSGLYSCGGLRSNGGTG